MTSSDCKSEIYCNEMNAVADTGYLAECKAVKRDPHNPGTIAVAYGRRFELIDLRAGFKSTISDGGCMHSTQNILDLDFNPIKVNTIASSG